MSYVICLTESDRDRLLSDHSQEVLDSLQYKVRKKNKELDWINNFNQLTKRFHNFFGSNNHHLAEMSFKAESKDYRAIFFLLENEKKLALCGVVDKSADNYLGSDQDNMIRALQNEPKEARSQIESKLREEQVIEV